MEERYYLLKLTNKKLMQQEQIYFDSAATTCIRPEVIEKMSHCLKDCYGNPSSTHSFGRKAKTVVESARKTIAKELNAHPSEIIFTSGGTEADNMILRSCVRDLKVKHIITSAIEHHAVLHTIDELCEHFDVTQHRVKLTENGSVDLEDLENLLEKTQSEKTLVSLMHVNNEIGNLLPIEKVAVLCKKYKALFHSDTVQSIGHYRWNTEQVPIDFMTAAAHKFHGPKGVGFAYIRKNSEIKPFIAGGAQERGFRAGTESIHNIKGLEEAFVQAYKLMDEETQYIKGLKSYFIEKIKESFPKAVFNGVSGDLEKSAYTLVNVGIPMSYEKAQIVLFTLDLHGIACSKGSACQSGSVQASHVLSAFMNEEALKIPALRFSFSYLNTHKEVDYVIDTLSNFVNN